jgi:integrase
MSTMTSASRCSPRVLDLMPPSGRQRRRVGETVNGAAHVFNRAVERAGIATGDVTLHTLRHTALSR